jgi:hypothetical protein
MAQTLFRFRISHPAWMFASSHGFQLNDPELLRVEEVAELWKYIYQHQQSDEFTTLRFTDEVFKFDRSMRNEVHPEKSKEARVDLALTPSLACQEKVPSLHYFLTKFCHLIRVHQEVGNCGTN